MARPAHPRSHDSRLTQALDEALGNGEKLLPCPDLASTKLMRSRIRELIRAHKEWDTGEFNRYRRIKTKIHHTHLILPVRSEYLVDSTRFPFTLALNSRDVMDEILGNAVSTEGHIPLTRRPQDASSAIELDDDDDQPQDENHYFNIINNMSK